MVTKSGAEEQGKSPLIVTRGDGIPLPDQAAALAEFKRQCLQSDKPRMLAGPLTDLIARLLHYQDKGEPDWMAMSFEETSAAWNRVPREVIQRYHNDPKFHHQVTRAVAKVMELLR